ncbi:signal sequence receptor [Culex quinquefasciatus]|uniref:Signal sequence receptor n=1 Tax=Culex quinquefasciatus TaxID=7176 RepID=B0XLR7_CULQU|nr:signal sequence receptor [Culex quinquefasciatus]|eukprot:XP_001870588.1 signal sequence receptor [Culex quinquefasciatus]
MATGQALLVLPTVLLTVDGGSRLKAQAAEDKLDTEVEREDASRTDQAEETEMDDEPETTKFRQYVPVVDPFATLRWIWFAIKPGHEATVSYSFLPSDSFAGHPFWLNIALFYRDASSNQFSEAVFNEIVSIRSTSARTARRFSMVLLLVLGQQFLGSYGKCKRSSAVHKTVKTGTTNTRDVDYEWIPAKTLKKIQNSLKGAKCSPSKALGSEAGRRRRLNPSRVSMLATISGTLFWSILPLRSLRAEILTGHTQSTTQLGQSVDGTLKFYLYGQEVT